MTELIGEKTLGFSRNDVGLHSLRSGGAMAMFLSGISEIIIQRVGRWESSAFLEYIREQVETFTFGVSNKMLQCENYHHVNTKKNRFEKIGKESNKNESQHNIENGGTTKIDYRVEYNNELFYQVRD